MTGEVPQGATGLDGNLCHWERIIEILEEDVAVNGQWSAVDHNPQCNAC